MAVRSYQDDENSSRIKIFKIDQKQPRKDCIRPLSTRQTSQTPHKKLSLASLFQSDTAITMVSEWFTFR